MNPETTVSLVSLGCAKNTVDSEVLLGTLASAGFHLVANPDSADVVVVNTCCFIEPATRETTDCIRHFETRRKEGSIKTLVVAGCLPQRYRNRNLKMQFPWVDAFLGPGDVPHITSVLTRAMAKKRVSRIAARPVWLYDHRSPRVRITLPHTAYVKIAEGCSHRCSFCLIPGLRGRFRSRRMRSVVEEVRQLARDGTLREVNLVAQDTTAYGSDLYGRPRLYDLLRRLGKEGCVPWIRLLYAYPRNFDRRLVDLIRSEPSICRYVDLPVQHCNDSILRRMRRGVTKRRILNLLEQLRTSIPGVTLRTTLMVGFPGETEAQFQELVDFVAEQRFDRLGVFAFSPEEGTPASRDPKQVPEPVKQERLEALMVLQQLISKERNRERKGHVIDVLVDGRDREDRTTLVGRTEGDAPEVDGAVLIPGGSAAPGEIVKVRVTGSTEYDLVAEEVRQG